MHRIIMVCAALGSVLFILPIPALSAPTITRDWVFIDNRPIDDIFGITGLRLNLTVKALADGVNPLSSATAVPSNPKFFTPTGFPGLPNPIPIDENVVFPITGGAEFTRLPSYDASKEDEVIGTFTYTVTDTGGKTATSISHTLDKFEIIDIPINLAFSNHSTTPLFTFDDPDSGPSTDNLRRDYVVDIFNASKINIFESDLLGTPSFEVPIGTLEEGKLYYFRAVSINFDREDFSGSELGHSNLENRAIAYAEFRTAVPEPSTLLLFGSGLIGLVAYGRKKFFKK